MYRIVERKRLSEQVVSIKVEAPAVAKKCKPGQFIILRVDEQGERIPLTVAEWDREAGWVRVIFQTVGLTTMMLADKQEGDYILDFVGPLGRASETEEYAGKKVAVIGGGLGCAIAWPQAKALKEAGADVDLIVGFRNKDLIILADEMKEASNNYYLMTDDGSAGDKGLVTAKLEECIQNGTQYDLVVAIGPLIMMKFVALTTKKYNIKTIVSMNPIMIDGTGMCGGCRLTVDGQTKFACVDGPDFDGHLVDFDEAMRRARTYSDTERAKAEHYKNHKCRMEGMNDGE